MVDMNESTSVILTVLSGSIDQRATMRVVLMELFKVQNARATQLNALNTPLK